ncbi:PAN domain-containing protein [Senna tora]|uniref:PAN domain-containing protein n=1 Tax=Senna tora TaxID=362788 RepID=A0A834TPK0_9FABA|nr:PAN domain-containing protein [Senna tora]
MNLFSFIFLLLICFNYASSGSDIHIGYQFMVVVPVDYRVGFTGRAFLIESNETAPNFKVALSVEAIDEKYSCSLQVFLGDVKVWDSGHETRFYTTEKCLIELTQDGDLRLTGPEDRMGWKTGTSGQGVEDDKSSLMIILCFLLCFNLKQRLQILRTGNLVLVDSLESIKWQSFNFPTDVMLWGQRLDVATRLTSYQSNSSFFYSFEIENKGIAMYLNTGELRYSYWEFKPSMNRNITFVKLGSRGLDLFGDNYKKIAQIPSLKGSPPLRFLALKNETGNFGLYYYSSEKAKFEASFQALNSTCDLPIACRPYGICTFSNACSCIRLLTKKNKGSSDCIEDISGGFCDGKEAEMLELENVGSVLKDDPTVVNISREACEDLCLQDCKCAAALYFRNASNGVQECYLYRLVQGLKQVEEGTGFSYMVKVPKGTGENDGPHNLKKWVFILVGAIDGLIILLIVGGVGYWMIRKKRNITLRSEVTTS